MPLALLLDVGRIVLSTLAEDYRTSEGRRCFEDEPLAAITLNRNALWAPFIAPAEWHLLNLVMFSSTSMTCIIISLLYYPSSGIVKEASCRKAARKALLTVGLGGIEAFSLSHQAICTSDCLLQSYALIGGAPTPSEQIYTTLNKR